MLKPILLALAIVAVSILLLSVKILLKPKGTFSSQHVSDNPALKKKGIHCVMKQDKEARAAAEKKLRVDKL
ncbi:MAG: hypothetical protein MJZ32_01080 [Bacteroidaceae bacterium]|nr:hypothetical protein [Bacteroidaceae bacterium]